MMAQFDPDFTALLFRLFQNLETVDKKITVLMIELNLYSDNEIQNIMPS